jgi:hypothetical protein
MEQGPRTCQVSKVLAYSNSMKQMRISRGSPSMVWASMLLVLLFAPSISSLPSGVGEMANDGCLCHGGASEATVVFISGLPVEFESNTTYNLSLQIDSSIEPSQDSHQGGFRFNVQGGGMVQFENTSEVQILEDGWTHDLAGTYQRQWNLTWTSPENSTEPVNFSLVGNAVNGNEQSDGDAWSLYDLSIPHVDGPPVEEVMSSQSDIGALDWTVFGAGLAALAFFLIRVLK